MFNYTSNANAPPWFNQRDINQVKSKKGDK